jgi:hypothetical protein
MVSTPFNIIARLGKFFVKDCFHLIFFYEEVNTLKVLGNRLLSSHNLGAILLGT